MFEVLERLDQDVTLAINRLHFEMGDYFWQFFSDTKIWAPLYLYIAYLIFKNLEWKKALIVLSSIIFTIVACDQIANLFKDGAERLRPCYDAYMLSGGLHVLEARTGFFGFFSAHAANAFGLAICSYIGLRHDESHRYDTYRWLIFVWAGLVAMSRIFAGKHFFGDVLVGTCMGLLIGWAFARLADHFIKKL